MEYTLIKGTFHVVGYSPDGDSIKFKANNIAHWNRINTEYWETFEEKLAAENGVITLRLQGVDALETHYTPKSLPPPKDLNQKGPETLKEPDPGGHKQPVELGKQATDAFMHLLEIKKVEWQSWGEHTWVSKVYIEKRGKDICIEEKHQDSIPGYIVTGDVEKNGRPIAWVFPGSAPERDGTQLTLDKLVSRIEKSANYQLLRKGFVYPYFFMTLAGKLREKLAEAAKQAQVEAAQQAQSYKQGKQKLPNIWLYDKTVEGVNITTLRKITDDYEIYPYLFRKTIKHWYRKNMERYWEALRDNRHASQTTSDKRISLKGFFDSGNPYVFVVSEQDFVRLDSVVEIKRNRLKMKKYPYDIVFLS
jgi:hypothetical protein